MPAGARWALSRDTQSQAHFGKDDGGGVRLRDPKRAILYSQTMRCAGTETGVVHDSRCQGQLTQGQKRLGSSFCFLHLLLHLLFMSLRGLTKKEKEKNVKIK